MTDTHRYSVRRFSRSSGAASMLGAHSKKTTRASCASTRYTALFRNAAWEFTISLELNWTGDHDCRDSICPLSLACSWLQNTSDEKSMIEKSPKCLRLGRIPTRHSSR